MSNAYPVVLGDQLISLKDGCRVEVRGPDKGYVEEQSVQAVLLFAILQELKALNAGPPRGGPPR